MTIEEELELALRAEAARIDPPVAELVSGGVTRGRELRRLRRARLAVGGAALALVAGAGSVLAVPFVGGDGDSGPVADDGRAGSETVAAPPQADPVAEIDPDAVLDAVVALLPPGEITDVTADALDPTSAWFDFVYDDGDGAGWISGSVAVAAVAEPPVCPVIVNGGTCEVRTLDDGTTLVLEAGPYYPQPDREPHRLQWRATAVAPSGLSVHVGEMNTPTEKQSEPTRSEPPFSLEQLAAVVTDDVWSELTAGVSPPPAPEDPGDEITDEARALAENLGPGWTPSGMDAADPGPDVTAGLPDGVEAGAAMIMEIGAELSVAQHCDPMEEKGRITQPCTTTTAPGGETVHVQWATTTLDGPYARGGYSAEVWVIAGTDERKFRVSLLVGDSADATTPERRDAMAAWLEEQVDDLARAATAALPGEQG
ncbi:hypothetical protein [Jiangella aurantiaca]|uniref:hypothetical protein n=1 Tax=Jiangella aurantiaca TaxID=2530373 RepID=UPI0013A5C3CF|nr:hypothetical protein [Jiangella aurantiaca]